MPILLTAFEQFKRLSAIISMAIKGIGANATITRLKALGLPIRRATGLKLYRQYAGIPAKENRIKYTPKRFVVARPNYTEAAGVMTRRYRYTVASEFRIKETGELKTFHTSMISDRPMSVGEIERMGGDVLKGLAGLYAAIITKQWLHKAEHREGDAWD